MYKDHDVAGLVVAGRETSWNDWGAKMAASKYYCDELCIEAVIAVYGVSIHILTGGSAPGGAYDSHKGRETNNPPIWLGCALETHFYSLIPNPSSTAVVVPDIINDPCASSAHVAVFDFETRKITNNDKIVDVEPAVPSVVRWGVIDDAGRVTRSSKKKM
jgi:hypothetical protein